MRSIANLGCNMYSKITVAHITLPKAVLNTVKIFAVQFCSNSFHLFSDSFQCECLPWNLCKWSYDIAVKVNELAFEAEEERKELTEYFRRFICGDPNDQRVHCCGDQIKS